MTLTLPELHAALPLTAGPVDLTPEQVRVLLLPIARNRVQHHRGNAHLEAWDVRRWLNRIFGFGGWALDTTELALVREIDLKGDGARWTVIYRAQVRLTVRTADGRTLTTFEDAAMGDSQNQPQLGQAHDQAMKTALSQALKRCAVNLGDPFGLSLYNDGSTDPVVVRTVPLVAGAAADPATPGLPEDAPVRPEPGTAPEDEQQQPERPAAPPQQPAEQSRSVDTARRRDYLAEARAAGSWGEFVAIRSAAVAAGCSDEYADALDRIAAGKRAAAEAEAARPKQQGQPGPTVDAGRSPAEVAEERLRIAASVAHLTTVDDDFHAVYGLPISEAPAHQLDEFRARIEAAGGQQ